LSQTNRLSVGGELRIFSILSLEHITMLYNKGTRCIFAYCTQQVLGYLQVLTLNISPFKYESKSASRENTQRYHLIRQTSSYFTILFNPTGISSPHWLLNSSSNVCSKGVVNPSLMNFCILNTCLLHTGLIMWQKNHLLIIFITFPWQHNYTKDKTGFELHLWLVFFATHMKWNNLSMYLIFNWSSILHPH